MLGVLAAVVAGALLAVAVASALSPFSLFGPVRQAEPGRGVYIDWTVLGLGALGLVRGPRRRWPRSSATARPRTAPPRGRSPPAAAPPWSGPGWAPGWAPPAWPGCGSRSSRGAGRTAVPVRSVLAGAVLAVIVVAATLTFGASLSYLISRPALYGWNFSYALYSTDGWGPLPAARTAPLLHRDKLIAATTGVYFLTARSTGRRCRPSCPRPTRRSVRSILDGHGLDGPGEIVLGPATLAALHKHVGDDGHGAARPGDPRRAAEDRRHRGAAGARRHAGHPSLAGHRRDPAHQRGVARPR